MYTITRSVDESDDEAIAAAGIDPGPDDLVVLDMVWWWPGRGSDYRKSQIDHRYPQLRADRTYSTGGLCRRRGPRTETCNRAVNLCLQAEADVAGFGDLGPVIAMH